MPETDWFLTLLSIKVSVDISVCFGVELSIGKLCSKQSIFWSFLYQNFLWECHLLLEASSQNYLMY